MVTVTVVRQWTEESYMGSISTKVLVRTEDEDQSHFLVSSIPHAFDTGRPETLVFPAGADGEVTKWMDVAGGVSVGIEEAIADLERVLNGGVRGHTTPFDVAFPFLGGIREELEREGR